jgi:hypothetical protein
MTVLASDSGEVLIQLPRVCVSLHHVQCYADGLWFGISGCKYYGSVCGDYWKSGGLHDNTDAVVREPGARTRCVPCWDFMETMAD